MLDLKMCPECGVPELMTSENLWLNNGDIVQNRDVTTRMLFIETDNLDPLYQGIEQIIGTSIEHLVIAAMRRAVRIFLGSFVPEDVREKLHRGEVDYGPVMDMFVDIGGFYGFGKYELMDMRFQGDEHDYFIYALNEPFSRPMAVASLVAAVEVITGADQGYTVEESPSGGSKITTFPSEHPRELRDRLHVEPYRHTDGDLELERCTTCGGPAALAEVQWQPDRGIISNRTTARRMAVLGDAELDPVFQELEAELGDAIPRAVVESQRRFTRSGFFNRDDLTDAQSFRTLLALRGLGNLRELEMNRNRMWLRLENAALPLIVIGQAQGFFELGFDTDSAADWQLTDDRTLELEVKPRPD